jgi:hypothetical protein
MPSDEMIRNLCFGVSQAQGDGEFAQRLEELRTAMREHFQGAQNLGIHLILKRRKVTIKDGTNG